MLTLLVLFLCYTFYLYKINFHANAKWGSSPDKGKKLWQEKNCNACHQVYGLGGYLGPDLTNVYSSRSKAHIQAFLKTGTNVMPDFGLNDEEIKNIIAYLKSMDTSGVAAPSQLKTNLDGTIER